MNKKLIITISVILGLSLLLNIYCIFIKPSPKILMERIKELEQKEKETEELLFSKQSDIDSILNIPLPNPIIIKQKIYEDISKTYQDGVFITNADTLIRKWAELANE